MEIKNLKIEELEIHAIKSDRVLRLEWAGAIHSADPGEYLDPYIDIVIDYAAQEGFSILCDFSRLDYMNSASIPPLIHLLRECGDREITTEFTYDSNRKVQTASFRALDVIARKSRFTSVKGI